MSVETATSPVSDFGKKVTTEERDDLDDYEVSLGSQESKEDASISSTSSSSNKSNKTASIKCSAVHTMERDMPTFDYSHLVKELRAMILEDCQQNPGLYSQKDIDKCRDDDWHLSRFLLRQKLDVKNAYEMLRKAMRFNNESLVHFIKPGDFPAEFYQIGGLFGYETDRKGNKMLYVRVKIHRKIQEINAVLQAFLYFNIHKVDQEAEGKGISIVFDCSGAGLANADMDMLLMLVQTLLNYFPKGFSYLLVHELPWILKPFWYIARAWLPEEYRSLVQFSNSRTINEYIDRENLPDFMGGTCKRDYRAAPENCTTLREAAKLWGIEKRVAKQILAKFVDHLPASKVEEIEREFAEDDENDEKNSS